MKTLNIKFIDRMILVFLYSIFFMITCLIIRALSYMTGLDEDIILVVTYSIVGILFLGLLVIRFTKLSVERVENFEYRAVTILTSKSATIVIVIIIVLIGLVIVFSMHFILFFNIVYSIFVIIIPVILIMLRNIINPKYLLIINTGAIWLFILAIIIPNNDDIVSDIISGVIYGSFEFYFLPYYLMIIIPLILFCILFYINCKLIFSAEKTYGVTSFQRLLGIIGFFLVVLVFFLFFAIVPISGKFESLYLFSIILVSFPAVVVPYYVYYLVIQILYEKHKREQEKIVIK